MTINLVQLIAALGVAIAMFDAWKRFGQFTGDLLESHGNFESLHDSSVITAAPITDRDSNGSTSPTDDSEVKVISDEAVNADVAWAIIQRLSYAWVIIILAPSLMSLVAASLQKP